MSDRSQASAARTRVSTDRARPDQELTGTFGNPGTFGDPTVERRGRERYFKYPVEASMAVDGRVETLRFELEDGSGDRNKRSFTFRVPRGPLDS